MGIVGIMGAKQPQHQIDILKVLIEHGADVNARDVSPRTPLFAAATATMDLEAVKLLVGHKADITARRGDAQCSILHEVINSIRTFEHNEHDDATLSDVRARRLAMTRLLLELGAPVDAKDVEGKTPLHEAARLDKVDTDLLSLLLDWGADVNAVRADGKTIVQAAAGKTAYAATQFLIDHGANDGRMAMKYLIPLRALRAIKSSEQLIDLATGMGQKKATR